MYQLDRFISQSLISSEYGRTRVTLIFVDIGSRVMKHVAATITVKGFATDLEH
jgi:hypothetical protein